ncbi:MAG: (2Fe-2S)-binding protein [Methylophilaceae bacterium]|nr:(2Fe-2S)-binding protein [Methylophilaceae bacterium]
MGSILYICICNAVTEREVYAAIDAGATTVKALNRQLGVGAECGACVGCAKACLSNKQTATTSPSQHIFPIAQQDIVMTLR